MYIDHDLIREEKKGTKTINRKNIQKEKEISS